MFIFSKAFGIVSTEPSCQSAGQISSEVQRIVISGRKSIWKQITIYLVVSTWGCSGANTAKHFY